MGVAHLEFRDSVCYHHDRKQGYMETDLVLEKELSAITT